MGKRRLARFLLRHACFEYGPPPLLSFDQAEEVGRRLHDHWERMAGAAPWERGDMAYADLVQFVVRQAREVGGG